MIAPTQYADRDGVAWDYEKGHRVRILIVTFFRGAKDDKSNRFHQPTPSLPTSGERAYGVASPASGGSSEKGFANGGPSGYDQARFVRGCGRSPVAFRAGFSP